MTVISELVFHVNVDIEEACKSLKALEERVTLGELREEDAIKEFDIRKYIKLEPKIKEGKQ